MTSLSLTAAPARSYQGLPGRVINSTTSWNCFNIKDIKER